MRLRNSFKLSQKADSNITVPLEVLLFIAAGKYLFRVFLRVFYSGLSIGINYPYYFYISVHAAGKLFRSRTAEVQSPD
jgi:hypothetical protein